MWLFSYVLQSRSVCCFVFFFFFFFVMLRQWHCVWIRFCSKLGKNGTEFFCSVKVAFGEYTVGRTLFLRGIKKWHGPCWKWWMLWPLIQQWAEQESVDQVMEFVLKNGRITVHELANMLEILFNSVQSILKTIWMCVRLLPTQFSACWMRSRKRTVSACARTFKTVHGHQI
jgi:hypothetical protein